MENDEHKQVPDSQAGNAGSMPLVAGRDNINELELPSLSLKERCERLLQDQADLQRFNVACKEDERRLDFWKICQI